ncbi:MAG: DUF2142 domain-containing protein [Solirubrobacteraceae bacterium]
MNAAIWGFVVPPFQVPDEVSHFAYVQYLAEAGEPPPQRAGEPPYSPQEATAIDELEVVPVIGFSSQRGIFDAAENEALHRALAKPQSTKGGGGSNAASNQPPLYYALELVPYLLSPSHELLFRLVLMRLLSALLAACTVLTVFMLIRELLPRTRWAPTVGALAVAFQPTFDFIAAGVNGDNLLFLTASLSFYALLRAYRRGFTARRGAWIGGAVAAGVLAKLTFIALLPGIALAILLLAWRALPAGRRDALRALATTVAIAVVPVGVYALLNVAVWHRGGITAGGVAGATNSRLPGGGVVTWNETLDYIWQLYLPRLPFMNHAFFTEGQLIHTWFDGSIGRFGWLDYGFPGWVYSWAKDIFIGLIALALIGLWRLRGGVRALLPLGACFAVVALGLMAAIGYTGVRYQLSTGEQFAQARYLFPLIAFYGLFVVLAAHAPPRRWAPALGALLVVLAMTHGLFAETLTISRYYG